MLLCHAVFMYERQSICRKCGFHTSGSMPNYFYILIVVSRKKRKLQRLMSLNKLIIPVLSDSAKWSDV